MLDTLSNQFMQRFIAMLCYVPQGIEEGRVKYSDRGTISASLQKGQVKASHYGSVSITNYLLLMHVTCMQPWLTISQTKEITSINPKPQNVSQQSTACVPGTKMCSLPAKKYVCTTSKPRDLPGLQEQLIVKTRCSQLNS